MENLYWMVIDFITRLITGLDNHNLSLMDFFLYYGVRKEVVSTVNFGITVICVLGLVISVYNLIALFIQMCAKSSD